MAELLKGAPAAKALNEATAQRLDTLKQQGVIPKLAILRVGARQDDLAYEAAAVKRCAALEIAVRQIALPETAAQTEVLAAIDDLNADDTVHGVLLFRPLPKHLDETALCARLAPEKDVDGITAGSMARVYSGVGAGFAPCTAESVLRLLRFYGVALAGKRAVVLGRSLVIGRPVAMLLQQADATVTMCHSKTARITEIARTADILVAATGQAESVSAEFLRPGQIVVDVGIHSSAKTQGLVGDVDFAAAEPIVHAITPVPGGVGSMTTAVLASHVVAAAENTI